MAEEITVGTVAPGGTPYLCTRAAGQPMDGRASPVHVHSRGPSPAVTPSGGARRLHSLSGAHPPHHARRHPPTRRGRAALTARHGDVTGEHSTPGALRQGGETQWRMANGEWRMRKTRTIRHSPFAIDSKNAIRPVRARRGQAGAPRRRGAGGGVAGGRGGARTRAHVL
jgi:hypothetical protein